MPVAAVLPEAAKVAIPGCEVPDVDGKVSTAAAVVGGGPPPAVATVEVLVECTVLPRPSSSRFSSLVIKPSMVVVTELLTAAARVSARSLMPVESVAPVVPLLPAAGPSPAIVPVGCPWRSSDISSLLLLLN